MFIKVLGIVYLTTVILQQTFTSSAPDTASDDDGDALEIEPRSGREDDNDWNKDDIESEYNVDDLQDLAFDVNKIYKNDLKSFKKMVKLQLYLYKLFDEKFDVNDDYVFNVAYYFSKIKNDVNYAQLSSKTKKTLDEYVSYLPPSATTLFLDSTFCLMNREYDSKYLYASNNEIDSERNYVFLHTKDDFNQKGKSEWTTTLKDVSSKHHTKLKFSLQSVTSKHYAYIERCSVDGKKNLLVSWNSDTKPTNSDWKIKLYQNQLILKQNGRIICASESLYSDSRCYVYGEDEDGEDVAACQWFALECPK